MKNDVRVWQASTDPCWTASNTCSGGTTSPAADTRISKRPSLISATRLAISSAEPCIASRLFGQLVASRHLTVAAPDCAVGAGCGAGCGACASAVIETAPAAAPVPALVKKSLRFIVIPPFTVRLLRIEKRFMLRGKPGGGLAPHPEHGQL